MYHDTKDLAGEESICEVVMEWNGERYAKPKWSCRRVFADGQALTPS